MALEFRVYAGPHQGAQFTLKAGSYVLGRDDSCDLIFNDADLAERQLRLQVEAQTVNVEPLEGKTLLKDQELKTKTAWPAGSALHLGSTILMWQLPGRSFAATLPEAKPAAPASDLAASPEQKSAEKTPEPDPDTAAAAAPAPAHSIGKLRLIFALSAALLLIGLLWMLVYGPSFFLQREAESQMQQALALSRNYPQVQMTRLNDSLALSGSVPDEQTLAKLTRQLPQGPLRYELKLQVSSDENHQILSYLKLQGFTAALQRLPKDKRRLSLYAQDEFVIAPYLDDLKQKYPKLEFNLVTKEKLEPFLVQESKRLKLSGLTFGYTKGSILYSGRLKLEDREQLRRLIAKAQDKFKAPLEFKDAQLMQQGGIAVYQQLELAAPKADEPAALAAAARKEAARALDPGEVMGVTLKPLRFISLRGGRRYFEGGVLPSGYTIKHISVDKIVLQKGEHRYEYALRRQ